MLALELAMGHPSRSWLSPAPRPGPRSAPGLLGALGLQRFEPLVHGLQVMTLPHAAHAGGRDREPPFPQLVGDPHLPEGRLLNGQRNDGILDLLGHAVFSSLAS